MTRPPGPRGAALLRTIAGRRVDPLRVLVELRERYGPLVHVRVGDTSQFLVSDLDGVRHVLIENARNYTKGPAYELLAALLGQGLVTSEGEHWKSHRRLVQPTLHRDRMHGFVAVMAGAAEEEAAAMARLAAAGRDIDLYERMMRLALQMVTRALFGADIAHREADVHAPLTEVFDHIERLSASRLRLLELLPGGSRLRGLRRRLMRLPTRHQRAFRAAIAALDRVIYDVIAQRRRALATGAAGADLVSALLLASEDGISLSDGDIRDEVMTMFIAGHETAATALTWCGWLLARHPQHQARIAAEADALPAPAAPTFADLARLGAAQRVFEEALRLYPPVWRISRYAAAPDRIGGYDVPCGSVIVISPYLLQRDAALWPEPDRFDPSRFEADAARARPRLAYLPFGAGQRMCLGGAFATAQAQIVLSALCRRVRLEPVPGQVEVFEPRVTLRPRGGMRLAVRPRQPAPFGGG